MRDVFAPLALGVENKDGNLNFYTMSDYLDNGNDLQLIVQVVDFSNGVKNEFRENVIAEANNSKVVKTFSISDLVSESKKSHTMIHAFLSDRDGNIISTKDYFFFWPNKLDLPETQIESRISYKDGEYSVTLTSNKLAKDVFIEISVLGAQFSDNFIDLLPGEERTIIITSPELKSADKTPVTFKHVRETY